MDENKALASGASPAGSVDRRQMLKRIGVAGGLVWTAPVLYQGLAHADGSQCSTVRELDWEAFAEDPLVFPKTVTYGTDVEIEITESFYGGTTSYGVMGDPDRGIYQTPVGGLPTTAPNDYSGPLVLIWQTAVLNGGRILTFNFTKPSTGLPVEVQDLEFWITDIDYTTGQYDDQVTVQADGVEPNFARTNVNNTRVVGTGTLADPFENNTQGNVGDGASGGSIRLNHPDPLTTFSINFWNGSRASGGQHAIFITNMTMDTCT